MQVAVQAGRKTKKWLPGPPLPFEFLPQEEQDRINQQKEAADRLKKEQDLKRLLDDKGEEDNTQTAKKKKKKTKN
jgi:hypothetical protein